MAQVWKLRELETNVHEHRITQQTLSEWTMVSSHVKTGGGSKAAQLLASSGDGMVVQLISSAHSQQQASMVVHVFPPHQLIMDRVGVRNGTVFGFNRGFQAVAYRMTSS